MGDEPRHAGDDEEGVPDLSRDAEVAEKRGDGAVHIDRQGLTAFFKDFLHGPSDTHRLSSQLEFLGHGKELFRPGVLGVDAVPEPGSPLAPGFHLGQYLFGRFGFRDLLFLDPPSDGELAALARRLDREGLSVVDVEVVRIGNEDRHTGNVLVTRDLRGILIDHSRTFRAGPAFVQAIPYSAKNVPPGDLMRRLPRALVDRVSALTEEELRGAVGDLLTEAEIKAVLARRVLLLEEVRRICGRFGERDVLY